jgi:hypothetical protein
MLELLLALGVFVFLLAASTTLQLKALRASEDAGRRARASMLARDYLNRAAVAPAHARTAVSAPDSSVTAAETVAPLQVDCRAGRGCTPERFRAFLVEDWMGAPTALQSGANRAVKGLPGGRFCQLTVGPAEAIALAWPALSAAVPVAQHPNCPMPDSALIQSLTLWGYGGRPR